MNSIEVSKLFPAGTVIVAYKGKMLGGVKSMPQWEIEQLVKENSYLKATDGVIADLKVANAISLEFEALNPENLDSPHNFDDSPGNLTFVPLDPENKIAYYFPLAKLKDAPELKDNKGINWNFEIICDENGIFAQKIKAND